MSRDERGWEFDLYNLPGAAGANRQHRGSHADVDLDENGLEVRIDEGSGYMAQSCSLTIPLDVMVELFTRAGFTVTPPSR